MRANSSALLQTPYDVSVMTLAAHEDKTYRGAYIASPSMPWVWGTLTLEPDRRFSGPYHLVWPRDLYHASTAQKVAGDDARKFLRVSTVVAPMRSKVTQRPAAAATGESARLGMDAGFQGDRTVSGKR